MMVRLKYMVLLTCLCCVGFVAVVRAQQETADKKFFVYVQNENGTPFYVKKDGAVLSSSPEGYIIIPGLTKGRYTLTIGFPGNKVPEASFNIDLRGNGDKGYLIRKSKKGFELLGLRNYDVITPLAVASAPGNRIIDLPAPANASPKKETADAGGDQPAVAAVDAAVKQEPAAPDDTAPGQVADSDAFSRMLNEITGGTSKPAASAPAREPAPGEDSREATEKPPVTEAKAPAEDKDMLPAGQDTPVAGGMIAPPEDTKHKKRKRRKKEEPQFITFMPDSSQAGTASRTAPPAAETTGEDMDTATAPGPEQRKLKQARRRAEKAAAEAAEAVNNDSGTGESKADTTRQLAIINSDCDQLADEDDFQKVRRKMASRSSEESMFRMAQKYFDDNICYSTAQVQSLTYLFMTDEYKYKFLEMAYPHVYDIQHFSRLEKTLSSDYYRGRFRAMVKK